jgi:hypothetical protein
MRSKMSGDLNNLIPTRLRSVLGMLLHWLRPYVVLPIQSAVRAASVRALKTWVGLPVRELSDETNLNQRDAARRTARGYGR